MQFNLSLFSKSKMNKSAFGFLILLLCLIALHTSAQDAAIKTIKGNVFDSNDHSPLPGVEVIVLPSGSGTITNMDGHFEVNGKEGDHSLVVKAMGFSSDTLEITDTDMMIHMGVRGSLGDVEIVHRLRSTEMDLLSTSNTQKIGSKELLKAACCNLSESFETTPSVDVGFTDAVSGYKQIQMLGLAGTHTSFTRENIPDVRGLAAITGLTFTPGTWVESMQLSKGAGSVANGYEGTAGQINVEWRKAFQEEEPTLFLNGYQSAYGRTEGNAVYRHDFKNGLSTNLLLHGRSDWRKVDENKDGFLDQPLGNTFIGANRWFYFSDAGWELQAGLKGVYTDYTGGQNDYKKNESSGNIWGYQQSIQRLEGWTKIGKVYPETPWKSMGLQLSGVSHQQESLYGNRNYDGKQQSIYANYIFQTIIDNTNHIIKAGASYQWDRYNEDFLNNNYKRTESVPGVFSEYSYNYLNKLNVVAGLRGDYHNLFGFFATPRLHIRYAPTETSTIRASIGRAQRTANIFAENISNLASNRIFDYAGFYQNGNYDFRPEVAWNMGINFMQKFLLNYRDGSISADYYYTRFQNQIVVDIEDPQHISFYNLNGPSFAHSFQVQLDYEPIRKLDVRLAYRFYNVKTEYHSGVKEKPLTAAHRAFLNIGYETNNQWKFDYTLNWTGSKRVPVHFLNGQQKESYYSPSFALMNAQISKSWKNSKYEVYGGVENLLNTMQPNLILNASNPYDNGFDAALIWGSAMGRNIYAGFRIKI